MYLITKWFGTFLCDKTGVKKEILFPKNEKEILKRLRKIENNDILPQEKKITKGVKVIVNEKRLHKLGEYTDSDPFLKEINIEPQDYGFSQDLFHKTSLFIVDNDIKIPEPFKQAKIPIVKIKNLEKVDDEEEFIELIQDS